MWCWAIPRGQTDAGSSQKRLLPFRVLLRFRIDPQFSHFFFFCFIRREISLSGEKNFSLPTQSAIVYHMRSNCVIRYMTNQSTSNVLSEAENLLSSDIHVTRNYMHDHLILSITKCPVSLLPNCNIDQGHILSPKLPATSKDKLLHLLSPEAHDLKACNLQLFSLEQGWGF